MLCPECGQEVQPAANFCSHCGASLQSAAAAATETTPPEPIVQVELEQGSTSASQPWDQPGTKVGDEIGGPDCRSGVMIWVPAGEFTMGTAEVAKSFGEDDFANAKPLHKVRITKGFWLGKYTVTNAQYQQYCQEVGADFPEDSDQGDNDPVVDVTWTDAAAYCRHSGLSLPTEAQWEYGAAGPESRRYPWGNGWDPKKCCNYENQGPKGQTFPVGSFPQGASWCGALDMAGNVDEWCQDWYAEGYYAHSPTDAPPGQAQAHPYSTSAVPGCLVGWCGAARGSAVRMSATLRTVPTTTRRTTTTTSGSVVRGLHNALSFGLWSFDLPPKVVPVVMLV